MDDKYTPLEKQLFEALEDAYDWLKAVRNCGSRPINPEALDEAFPPIETAMDAYKAKENV